ncbi:MAG: hypothetical protein Q4B68_08540 [Bacteroidales bacterium]|nr:hypothetical protein [Bacteroidales bacterium]
MKQPKLRDSRLLGKELFPLGEIPSEIVKKIGAGIVFRLHTGRKDISGDDWGDILASAVGGQHLGKPLGISDVITDTIAWSAKTVKNPSPFNQTIARLISGRNSPDYSYGIEDPHDDIQKTGDAVLGIWNGRVDIAKAHHPKIRAIVLIRNYECSEFVLYEEPIEHFNIREFEWRENKNSNLEGYVKGTDIKRFIWQPHGSQFTIVSVVPDNAIKFRVRRPPIQTQEDVLKNIGFDDSWIEIIG